MDRQNNELVQRALKIIREQGGRGLKVAALADQLGVSRRTLQREMKKQRNTTHSFWLVFSISVEVRRKCWIGKPSTARL